MRKVQRVALDCDSKDELEKNTRTQSSTRGRNKLSSILFWLVLCISIPFVLICISGKAAFPPSGISGVPHQLTKYAVAAISQPLHVFQVYPPVLTPAGHIATFTDDGALEEPSVTVQQDSNGCVVHQMLMRHKFANSYNKPFVAAYKPPECDFNRVIFNLTIRTKGRQFDRLGMVYFGSTEIWRLSTAEPTEDGIEFGYVKDMSNYLSLFKTEQKLIFDLGNVITNIYTASLNATLKATFFSSKDVVDAADEIYSISAKRARENQQSSFQYPQMKASERVTLSRNTRRAVFSVAATGQIDEEFWFGNVLTSEADTFGKGFLLPYSPFREVQLRIDGRLAGVVWPFPIIFTGGIVPGFWRPIVGIDAFDLKEDEIDITPWLPHLCDGKSHSFELNVTGINDNGKGKGHLTPSIGSYWLLTGKIFTWLDPKGHITTGSAISSKSQSPDIQLSSKVLQTSNGSKNKSLAFTVNVSRQFHISSTVRTRSGSHKTTWSQNLQYANHGKIDNRGLTQFIKQLTTGRDVSSTGYSRQIEYPITVNTTFQVFPSNAFSISGKLSRGQKIQIDGNAVFPSGLESYNKALKEKDSGNVKFSGSVLHTRQNGSAYYHVNAKNTKPTGFGTTQQDLTFTGYRHRGKGPEHAAELYKRHVLAVNLTIKEDNERLLGHPFVRFDASPAAFGKADYGYAAKSIRRTLGRGPQAP